MTKLLTLLFLLIAAPSWAAFAEVGSGSQRASGASSGGNKAVAFPGNIASGNLLIAAGMARDGNGAGSMTIGCADSISTSYSVLLSSNFNGDNRLFIAYGVAGSSAANTITCTQTGGGGGSQAVGFAIDEFSGQNASPLDTDGGQSSGTSTSPSDSLTTGMANALVIGVVIHNDATNPSITPGGSYTQIAEDEDYDADNIDFNVVFRIATTATSYSVDWTLGSSTLWGAYTASFKPATGGGGGARVTSGGFQ